MACPQPGDLSWVESELASDPLVRLYSSHVLDSVTIVPASSAKSASEVVDATVTIGEQLHPLPTNVLGSKLS